MGQRERQPVKAAEVEVDDAVDPVVAERVTVQGAAACPLCRDALTALPRLEVCPTCQMIHHEACVVEMGRCGTMGCGGLTAGRSPDSDQRNMALLAHFLIAIGAQFLGPGLVYLMTRKRHPFASHHAKQALVFSLISILLGVTVVGIPVVFVLALRAAARARRGKWDPYPFLSRWIRPPGAAEKGVTGAASPKDAPVAGDEAAQPEEIAEDGASLVPA